MAKLSPIRECKGTDVLCNYTEFRVANEKNMNDNIWYREDNDFTMNERAGAYAGNTEEATPSGSPRVKNEIINFAETKEFTFSEDSNSAFMQMLHEVQLQGDAYILQFMNCGLDYKKVQCFSNGSLTIQTYLGLQTTAMDKIFEKKDGAENEVAWSAEAGSAPTNTTIGFTAPLPESMVDVSIEADITTTTNSISVDVTSVVDGDVSVIPTVPAGNEIIAVLYDITDKSLSNVVEIRYDANPPLAPIVFSSLTTGKYLVALGYHAFVDSNGTSEYRFVNDTIVEVA